jgi:hypothetical protein
MKTISRIWFLLAGFLIIAGVVYGVTAHELTGAALLVVASGVFCYLGIIGRGIARGEPPQETEGSGGVEEIHVGPTIWPFAFSIAAIFIVLGLIVTKVLIAVGAVFFALSARGWVRAVSQGHREVEGPP